jgi:hypothetical protein
MILRYRGSLYLFPGQNLQLWDVIKISDFMLAVFGATGRFLCDLRLLCGSTVIPLLM